MDLAVFQEGKRVEPYCYYFGMAVDDICPACENTRVRFMPVSTPDGDFELDEYPCPICCASMWSEGFPGERFGEVWIIPPFGPGGVPEYNGWPQP